jgi:phytoene dehydrogenase-like protein
MTTPDIIVIGAGHNGLVAATYLAKAGRKVMVLERRDVAGGQLAGDSRSAAFAAQSLRPGGRLRADIAADLDLARHGYTTAQPGSDPAYVAMLPDGGALRLSASPNDAATLESIRRLSARDAERWPEFVRFMDTAAALLDAAQRTPMPPLTNAALRAEGRPLAMLAWKLRRLGRRDMFRVMRYLSMSAQEFGEEWFESEPLKAALGALAVHGVTMGSMSAGGGYTLIHNWLNRGGPAHRMLPDGAVRISDALVAALDAAGGRLRTDASVTQILVDKQQVRGVRLASGEEITAATVVSGADPRRTLLGLVGAPELPPEFVWQTQSIKMRGSVAKVYVRTDGGHDLPDGTIAVAPTLKYLERAYDAAKYGEISREPYLEITTSGEVVSIHFQFAPYLLRQGDWRDLSATLERLAIDTVAGQFAGFRERVREIHSITPLDLEQTWGLTEGDLNHGQLILDQLLFMRPMPGWSDHRTPIDGLFLCGSGVHGGGGVSGASGRNAARVVLKSGQGVSV